MPSAYTQNLRLEQQFTGENINVWGVLLNAVLARLDSAIAGLKIIALTGNYTLTTANGVDDEARNAAIKTTGTGTFTVTIPSVSKIYVWWNACTGPVTITTGSGATVTLASGESTELLCDAVNVKRVINQDMGGLRLTGVGAPTASTDAATKGYVDGTAWALSSGNLPAQSGNANLFLKTDGTTPSWAVPTIGNTALFESNAVSFYTLRAGGSQVVGLYGGTDGGLGLINVSSQWRFKTYADGTGYLVTDSGTTFNIVTSNTIATYTAPLASNIAAVQQGLSTVKFLTINNGVLTVDLSQGTAFTCTLNQNISNVAYLNAPAAGVRKDWVLTFIGNTTANTIAWTHNTSTWSGNVVHNGGTAPVVNTTVGVNTTLGQWTDDGGVKVRNSKVGETL